MSMNSFPASTPFVRKPYFKMKAIILVGGPTKGTRFRPISLSEQFVPKPLFPLAGRPMILHLIEACVKLPEVQEILLIGFYEESLFSEFTTTTSEKLNTPIKYIKEKESLGSAGALIAFRNEILDGNPEYFFLAHCDIAARFPLMEMLRFHKQHGRPVTVMGKRVPPDEARAYGCMAKDPSTNECLHYAEKPETFVTDLINCGLYLCSPSFFDVLNEAGVRLKAVRMAAKELLNEEAYISEGVSPLALAEGGITVLDHSDSVNPNYIRLEQDVLTPYSGKKMIQIYETKGFWSQIKSVGSAIKVSDFYMEDYRCTHPEALYTTDPRAPPNTQPECVGTVMLHPTAEVHPSARLGPNVFISANVKIGAGVRIKHSIVLDNCEIRSHACILYAVIGWGSRISQWARVEGVPDYNPLSRKQVSGIVIIGEGVKVGPEVVVRSCIVLPHKEISRSCHNQVLL
mmetsp:Transcript_22148/g.36686  ORF Transcript_22148/g.36686 Transcript_22148/m.36686 type:complete len:458 (+) Transcript_22148:1299-2672(+)